MRRAWTTLALCAARAAGPPGRVAHAQEAAAEAGALLSAPTPSGPPLLEVASGLGRPAPRGGARRVPSPRITARFRPAQPASERRPARVALVSEGEAGAALRSLLSTDLSYVREVRLEDEGTYVLEATGDRAGDEIAARLELRHRDAPEGGALRSAYGGPESGLARWVHGFVDEAVEALGARRGAFRSRLLLARRRGPGRKDVLALDADGNHAEVVSSGEGIATLPGFGPDGVWYSVVTPTGVFITRSGLGDRPVVGGRGTHMGPTTCGGRLLYSSSRDGNTDIWSAALDGSDARRLTDHAAIDVSPTCAPDGRIAFISDRTGTPQIWVMSADGAGQRQITRGTGAQTPAWCGDLIAFTQVGGGEPMRIVVLDTSTGEARRVSPRGGVHKDPAFSPDCRMLGWVSPRGVEVATPDGRLQRLVLPGHAETLRWSR